MRLKPEQNSICVQELVSSLTPLNTFNRGRSSITVLFDTDTDSEMKNCAGFIKQLVTENKNQDLPSLILIINEKRDSLQSVH